MERRNNKDDRIEGTSIRKPGQEKLLFRCAPAVQDIVFIVDRRKYNKRNGRLDFQYKERREVPI